ncbi:MAG: ABC transporter permease [Deltaproteobacteria bacterium]|nr:ABC transporter permease [Deltaproteobacteria bacterium]
MGGYILRRLFQSLIVVLLVTIMVFLLVRLLPGDPILIYVSRDQLSGAVAQETIDALRQEYGLDRPVPVQYVIWIWKVLHLDLGNSIFLNDTVANELARAVPKTLLIGSLGLLLAIVMSIPAGVLAAIRRGTWIDTGVTLFANIGVTIPVFWLGIMLIEIFSLWLGLLPVQGYTSPLKDFGEGVSKIVMPVLCLAVFPLCALTRQVRSGMLETIRQDYIRTAWSKGLSEATIIRRHGLKNSFLPVVTVVGMMARVTIGGQVLIETVFNIPGMGRLAVEALQNQDYPVLQGVVLTTAVLVSAINLIVDLSYGWLDPRIRLGQELKQ